MVEKMDHSPPNRSIRHRSRLRLLRLLHILQQHLLPFSPHGWEMRRGGIRGVCGYGYTEQLSVAIHQFLFRDL